MAKDKKKETVEEVAETTEPTAEEKLTQELNETKDKLLLVFTSFAGSTAMAFISLTFPSLSNGSVFEKS